MDPSRTKGPHWGLVATMTLQQYAATYMGIRVPLHTQSYKKLPVWMRINLISDRTFAARSSILLVKNSTCFKCRKRTYFLDRRDPPGRTFLSNAREFGCHSDGRAGFWPRCRHRAGSRCGSSHRDSTAMAILERIAVRSRLKRRRSHRWQVSARLFSCMP